MNLAYIKHWGVKGGKANWHVGKSMKPDDISYCGALVLFYYINVKKTEEENAKLIFFLLSKRNSS